MSKLARFGRMGGWCIHGPCWSTPVRFEAFEDLGKHANEKHPTEGVIEYWAEHLSSEGKSACRVESFSTDESRERPA